MRKIFKSSLTFLVPIIIFSSINFKGEGFKNEFSASKRAVELARSDVQKTYFYSLQEAPVDLNRPFLLIFFNVSCHVCWDELFVWREFVETRHIPVQLAGITRDPEEAVSHFLKKYPLTFPIIVDRQGHLFRFYRVRLEPFLILGRGQEIIYKDNLIEPMAKRRAKLEQCLLTLY